MRLIHFIESNYFLETKGRIAIGTPETQDRFQQLVVWLCECIKQDPEPLMKGGKVLILWESIGGTRLCMAQDLRAEILRHFPKMDIEVRQMTEWIYRHWFTKNPINLFLKDDKIMEEIDKNQVRYLIVVT